MNSPEGCYSLQTGFAKAKTFYLASLFLPRDKRETAYAVYALCRISDETVDDARAGRPQERLTQLSRSIACAYGRGKIDDELLLAFRKTVHRCGIPQRYFQELIAGMKNSWAFACGKTTLLLTR